MKTIEGFSFGRVGSGKWRVGRNTENIIFCILHQGNTIRVYGVDCEDNYFIMAKQKHLLTVVLVLSCLFVCSENASAQLTEKMKTILPANTIAYGNIPYANDTSHFHLLDIYLPANTSKPLPVVVWIHGGAWMLNDKYADMGYMKNTVKSFLDSGYALASIDYRYSTTAPFPAQIKDCNQAIQFSVRQCRQIQTRQRQVCIDWFLCRRTFGFIAGFVFK